MLSTMRWLVNAIFMVKKKMAKTNISCRHSFSFSFTFYIKKRKRRNGKDIAEAFINSKYQKVIAFKTDEKKNK